MRAQNKYSGGASTDAILLTVIKLVTTALGLIITRLLSEYLTVHEYGTYSQIMLIVSTVSSLTMLGMMDGMNYFYCSERDPQKRESYVSTILTFQCIISTVFGCIVMLLSVPLCTFFDNDSIKSLLLFAAALPLLQNVLNLLQILIVSCGKAKVLAVRNFAVAFLRLCAVLGVLLIWRNVGLILAITLLLDTAQIVFFFLYLRKNCVHVRISKINISLVKNILSYCAPMAIFIFVNTFNRDIDKYVISSLTDIETVALYSNASKMLPFDIIMLSFCTVLIPHITKHIAERQYKIASDLYKLFLEIAYITTGVLCFAALSSAPQLMTLLYSSKYISGLGVFCVYIVVDCFRFTNITLVLSAAGKTKWLMGVGVGAVTFNAVLNLFLYYLLGIIGPAVATLITTIISGIIMLSCGSKILNSRLSDVFDIKYLLLFVAENISLLLLMTKISSLLSGMNIHYFLQLIIISGSYVLIMFILNGKRLLLDMKQVNSISRKENQS